jgi:hypothetical protein
MRRIPFRGYLLERWRWPSAVSAAWARSCLPVSPRFSPLCHALNSTIPAICSFCAGCLLTCSMAAVLIWAVFTIAVSSPAYSAACAADSNIWVFCLLFIIIMPLVGCLVGVVVQLANLGVVMKMIPSVMNFIIAVWGILLWANLSDDCEKYYTREYPSLLLLFKISVIFLICTFVLLVCALCIATTTLVGAFTQGGPERYENIPDSTEKSAETEEYV